MKNRLPSWFRQDFPGEASLSRLRLVDELGVNTVCKSAKCPNINQCFKNQRLTFMLLGDKCSRDCRFCAVEKSPGSLLAFDQEEPLKVMELVKRLGLNYVVITSVTRDDLDDGGSSVFAKTIESIRQINCRIKIEALIPDFAGSSASLKTVIFSGPNVLAHNLETVSRLYRDVRPVADYGLSLKLLSEIKKIKPDLITKSSLMLGLGETEEEVISALEDLRSSRCDILTLGQYLAPSIHHYPVKAFISLTQFERYRKIALHLGFKAVLSGPLVRSSYRAEEIYKEVTESYGKLQM